MKKSNWLYLYIYLYISVSLNGQVIHSNEIEKGTSIQRNASFNMDEIKVRWKKAALENCPGVPCIVTPPPPPSFTCGTSTITDIDNNIYSTVSIGAQCWTTTNLKVTKYNDGTAIPLNNTYTSGTVSTVWQGLTTGAYAIYDNQASSGTNATNYGFLYNWYAVGDSRKLCPAGWHVPTDAEWSIMIQQLDNTASAVLGVESTTAGTVMKSDVTNSSVGSGLGWDPGSPGTNTSGFSVLPGGRRSNDGSFYAIRAIAFFWSATVAGSSNAWNRDLNRFNGNVTRNYHNKVDGNSVRCLRD